MPPPFSPGSTPTQPLATSSSSSSKPSSAQVLQKIPAPPSSTALFSARRQPMPSPSTSQAVIRSPSTAQQVPHPSPSQKTTGGFLKTSLLPLQMISSLREMSLQPFSTLSLQTTHALRASAKPSRSMSLITTSSAPSKQQNFPAPAITTSFMTSLAPPPITPSPIKATATTSALVTTN